MFNIRYKKDNSKEPEKRSRFLVIAASLMLMWVSWWYCFQSNPGLFVLTVICALAAISMSKTFPKNSRWYVWSWLVVTILCIIVSITKLVPADGDVMSGDYLTNRFVIVFYAYALVSIFYCSGRLRVTSVAACCMPMVMAVLWESSTTQITGVMKQIFLWIFIFIFIFMYDLVQSTRVMKFSGTGMRIKENIFRWTKYVVIIVVAILVSPKVELSAYKFQDFVLGFDIGLLNSSARNRQSEYMYLGASLPSNFHKREKLILLISADRTPGYLREDVYVKYAKGQWYKGVATTNQIDYVKQLSFSESDKLVYTLSQYEENTKNVWNIEVISPGYISAICLPGKALTLSSDDSSFTIDANGAVYPEESNMMPDRYNISVATRGVLEGVQQIPETFDKQTYLAVPTNMTKAVDEWVNNCEGLKEADSVDQAVSTLQDYFVTNFKYEMRIRLEKSHPLVDFMKKKQGYCIHFASATAFMLRSCGIPSRVVGGFVCYEWNPWIKRFVVREREGHAWVEAWDNTKKRWRIVETTPPAGIPDSNDNPDVFRLTIDWFVFWWKNFLYTLGKADVFGVAADFLTVVFLFVWHFLISIKGLLTLIVIGLFAFRQKLKHKEQKSADDVLREKLTSTMCILANKMVVERSRRRESESWDLWLIRIKDSLNSETYEELANLIESYQSLRYQKKLDHLKANEWLEKH